jgi:excisionase family DNA binding protein
MEIFLRIVEGLFLSEFLFSNSLILFYFLKKYLSNNTKGGSAMKESYKSFDELPMMLSVSQIAKVLGISRTRSYDLVNEKGFPKIKIGTRIVVPKDEFKLWIQKQIKKG